MLHHHKKIRAGIGMLAAMLALLPAGSWAASGKGETVFVGSGHANIETFWLDLTSGELTGLGQTTEIKAPSFLALSPNHNFLYAITEAGAKEASVTAFQVAGAQLRRLNSRSTGGAGPCYVSVDPKGADVLVANYSSGSVSVFPIEVDGTLGAMAAFVQDHGSSVNPQRQEGPHAHCIITDPADRFVFACDLGLDKVQIFKFDRSEGTLTANDPAFVSIKPGSGPRHIAFSPDARHAYVANEMASTVTAFDYDRHRGTLTEIGNYPMLPEDFKGRNNAAEIAVHPSGKFVYASNRGDDSIVVFGRDRKTGRLTFIERDSTGGKTPRNFEIDPTGAYLLAANQDSDTIVVFRIDSKTGQLRPTGGKATANFPNCVQCGPVENAGGLH